MHTSNPTKYTYLHNYYLLKSALIFMPMLYIMPIRPYKLDESNLDTGDLACIYVLPQNLIVPKHTNLYIKTCASSSYTIVCTLLSHIHRRRQDARIHCVGKGEGFVKNG